MTSQPISAQIEDRKVMRQADVEHLAAALAKGDRVIAHGYVDSIIDLSREIEDLESARTVATR